MGQVDTRQAGVRAVDVLNLLPAGPQDYRIALTLQQELHREVASGIRPSTIVLLEHAPVFTAGKRTELHERPVLNQVGSTPIVDVDRGGKITWHGPGQLIGYPIIRLRNPMELVGYVREIEGSIIEILAEFGINGGRVSGRSGVWVDEKRKIAAIGIRVAQGVTMHGFAINANCSLEPFNEIVPCGISDAEVTSISRELGEEVSIDTIIPHLAKRMLPILESLQ